MRGAPDAVQDVVRWTRRVWNEAAVGLLYDHCAHNVAVHRPGGEHYGREAVVEHALTLLAAFPDLRLTGEEVVWAEDDAGLHVSQRLSWTGHHRGHGRYGPPTGRRVRGRMATLRTLRGGRVVEEWAVSDELGLAGQLGLNGVDLAGMPVDSAPPIFGEVARTRGQLAPEVPAGDPRDPGALPHLIAAGVWNARRLDRLGELYAPGAAITLPGVQSSGPAGLRAAALGILAAFPDGAVTVDHTFSTVDHTSGHLLAARWTFQGTHRGPGPLGPPTGRRVAVPGLSHLHLRAGHVVRETTLWDGAALLGQLHTPGD